VLFNCGQLFSISIYCSTDDFSFPIFEAPPQAGLFCGPESRIRTAVGVTSVYITLLPNVRAIRLPTKMVITITTIATNRCSAIALVAEAP
jgi:hypothetical protein